MIHNDKKTTLELWEENITHQVIVEHQRIAVATSGGVDSMVLLHKLVAKRAQDLAVGSAKWELMVVHVNFGLRGSDSEADAAFVQTKARELDLPLHYHKAPPPPKKTGIQEWAREIRYNVFYSLANLGWVIAMAHHSDDLAESIIFRMARGTSAPHIAGMSVWHKPFLRPFLAVSKSDIITYAQQEKISFREDSSNAETKYSRNKIRHQVLPILEDLFPGATQRIANLGLDIARIGELRQNDLKKKILTSLANPKQLTREAYQSLKKSGFTPHEIIDGYLKLNDTYLDLSQVHYKNIVQQIEKRQNSKNSLWHLHLPEETVLKWQKNYLSINKFSSEGRPIPANQEIQSQNLKGLMTFDILVPSHATLSIRPSFAGPISGFIPIPKKIKKKTEDIRISLALDASVRNLRLRRPTNSEKLIFFGHPKALTFKEIFMELGVPISLRHKYFVISEERKLNWLCDGKDIYKVDLQNKQLIRLNNF